MAGTDVVARWLQEAKEDAPRNAYVALTLMALLAVLQVTAVLAALLSARAPARADSVDGSDCEQPLQRRPPSYNR